MRRSYTCGARGDTPYRPRAENAMSKAPAKKAAVKKPAVPYKESPEYLALLKRAKKHPGARALMRMDPAALEYAEQIRRRA